MVIKISSKLSCKEFCKVTFNSYILNMTVTVVFSWKFSRPFSQVHDKMTIFEGKKKNSKSQSLREYVIPQVQNCLFYVSF